MAPTATAAAKAMTPTSRCSRPRRAAAANAQRGFTLLEILLVLGIIALAAALVVPSLTGAESRSFAAQLRELTAQLNYARRNAVVAGQVSLIELSNAAPPEGASDEAPAAVSTALTRWTTDNLDLAFNAAGVESDRRDRGPSSLDYEPTPRVEISFYPEGGSSGGALELSQDGQRAWIAIDSFTGRVSLSRDDER